MADSGTFQVNPDDLSSSYPHFQAASAAINGAAGSLKKAVTDAISSFDGSTHKNLQTLGDTCVNNLQDLAHAMDDIANRLQKSAHSAQDTDHNIARGFDPSSS